jgi:hypothetical protein
MIEKYNTTESKSKSGWSQSAFTDTFPPFIEQLAIRY